MYLQIAYGFRYPLILLALGVLLESSCKNESRRAGRDWPTYGGNNAGNRYSPLKQINTDNVQDLQVAWTYDVREDSNTEGGRPGQIQCQPIVINGVLYGTTAQLQLFAVEAGTGKQLWKFDPFTEEPGRYRPNRGVNYWKKGDDQRILYTAGANLFAIDATTGQPVRSFGDQGRIDLHTGLENGYDEFKELAVTATSPGVIYEDIFITGSSVSESGDALPGHIRGFDVRTGQLRWTFHTIPQPGEFGYDTWPEDAYKKIGGANCWAGMVLDEERGVVYLGTGSPSVDFYGGDRAGKNLFGNCILALDAATGHRIWHYQTIHHDLWDLDLPCPPNLVTVTHQGKQVDAVVQTTKDGLVYVLDRDSGESLFPVEERPVPASDVPGEQAWTTQKFPSKPLPFTRQMYTDADIPDPDMFPEAHALVSEAFDQLRHGEKFIPPSREGTVSFGISGGAEWGGNAVSPDGILYQNASEMPWLVRLTEMASEMNASTSEGNSLYLTHCASCHGVDRSGGGGHGGNQIPSLLDIGPRLSRSAVEALLLSGSGRMPSFQHIAETDRQAIVNFLLEPGTQSTTTGQQDSDMAGQQNEFPYIPPYIKSQGDKFLDKDGYPAISPPWGTLNAINLNTGEYVWRVPLGEFPDLTEQGIPLTGTENSGGPLVTAGGLVFIAGTRDERIRAFDRETGRVVWEYQLETGAFATPITYEVDGKQFLVIAVGGNRHGHKPGGWYVAFALK